VRTPASTRRWYETLRCASVLTPRRRQDAKGTLREHQRRYWRPRAITRLRTNPRSCSSFVPATSRPCPPFPPRCSMVRRGSTVRVRQRLEIPANQHPSLSKLTRPDTWYGGGQRGANLQALRLLGVRNGQLRGTLREHQPYAAPSGRTSGRTRRIKRAWRRASRVAADARSGACHGAFMEQNGRNRSQPAAASIGRKTA
jgi:hypothetical protein